MPNRSQRRKMGKQVKASQRQAKRRARQFPRCPLCSNEITAPDVVKVEVEGQEVKVHRTCSERLEQAKAMQTVQRMQSTGFWLPGSE